jgi:hypothetical protein
MSIGAAVDPWAAKPEVHRRNAAEKATPNAANALYRGIVDILETAFWKPVIASSYLL